MQIILDDKDKSYIDKLNQDLQEGKNIPLFVPKKRNYSVSFDVLDVAKANAFILGIVMNPTNEKVKEVEENLGIRFTSINYSSGDAKLSELKQYLEEFMNKLNTM